MYETQLTVVGTLITAVDKRRLADGTTVVNFRVASNERRYDRGSEAWTDGDSLYVSVTAWRRLAENVHASFVVGDPIVVRGRLFSRNYEKDGRRHSVTELEASAVGPDLARSTAVISRTRRADTPAAGRSAASDTTSGDEAGGDLARDDPWRSGLIEPSGPLDGESGLGSDDCAVPADVGVPSPEAAADGHRSAVEAAVRA